MIFEACLGLERDRKDYLSSESVSLSRLVFHCCSSPYKVASFLLFRCRAYLYSRYPAGSNQILKHAKGIRMEGEVDVLSSLIPLEFDLG